MLGEELVELANALRIREQLRPPSAHPSVLSRHTCHVCSAAAWTRIVEREDSVDKCDFIERMSKRRLDACRGSSKRRPLQRGHDSHSIRSSFSAQGRVYSQRSKSPTPESGLGCRHQCCRPVHVNPSRSRAVKATGVPRS